jgi:two-component system response regulator YesN
MKRVPQFLCKKGNAKKPIPLLTLLGTYLLILVVPIFISILFYSRAVQIQYSSAKDENRNALQYASVVLERCIDEISVMANQLATNQSVVGFQGKSAPFVYPNSYSILKTRNDLPNFNSTNEFLYDYFIFFNRSQLVMNSQLTYTYQQFYDLYMSIDGLSYSQWEQQLEGCAQLPVGLQQETNYVVKKSNETSSQLVAIPFYHPLLSHGGDDGFILFLISKYQVSSLLSPVSLNDENIVYIEDKAGNLITCLSETPQGLETIRQSLKQRPAEGELVKVEMNGRDMLATTVESTHFRFVAVQAEDTVLKKVTDLKAILLSVLVFSGMFSVAAAFFFARRTAKPLQEILNHLPEDENRTGDIFHILKTEFAEVQNTNTLLRRTLQSQTPLLKKSFLLRAIHTEFTSREEMEQMGAEFLPVKDHLYCMLLVKAEAQNHGYDSLDFATLSTLTHLVEQVFLRIAENVVCCNVKEDQLAVLIYYPTCEYKDFECKVGKVITTLQGSLPVNIIDSIAIAGGSIIESLCQISESFEKAQQAFSAVSPHVDSGIFWYRENQNYKPFYYFPNDVEIKLNSAVVNGDKREMDRLLALLFEKNFKELHLSPILRKYFVYHLICILTKLSQQISLNDQFDYQKIQELDHIPQLNDQKQEQALLSAFDTLCSAVHETVPENSLSQQILEYINEHFWEDSISLASISSKFCINESYLSYSFKQWNGVKLSVYIENLRIQKAKVLLLQTSLSISQIALQIGYLSANSFCRAFKRVTGINATTYRANGQ